MNPIHHDAHDHNQNHAAKRKLTSLPILHELKDPRFIKNAPKSLYELHKLPGPGIFRSPFSNELLVTRHQALNTLMSDARMGAQLQEQADAELWNGKLGMLRRNNPFNIQEPSHTVIRRILFKLIARPTIVNELRPLAYEIAMELLRDLKGKGRVDLVKDFAFPLAHRLWAEMLDIPIDTAAELQLLANAMSSSFNFHFNMRDKEKIDTAAERVWNVISATRFSEGENLFNSVEQSLSEVDSANEFSAKGIIAGMNFDINHTAPGMTANALHLLRNNDEILNRLRDDHKKISDAWLEATRYISPVLGLRRSTLETVTLEGIEIPAGINIITYWAAGNMDPEAFPEPSTFNIDRKNLNQVIAFGGGNRSCLGRNIAKALGIAAIEALINSEFEITPLKHQVDWGNQISLIRVVDEIPVIVN